MQRSKILIICIGVVVFAAFLVGLRLNYETNDDPLMLFISSGALNGIPDEHLQCIHIFPGRFLRLLYAVWPAFPWYGAMLASLHLLAVISMVLAVAYRRDVTAAELLFFSISVLLGYEALFLVKMQFTSTAFVAGFAGVFLLLSRFGQAIRLTGFVLFTIVALLLRKEVFIPVLAFAGVAMWHQVRLGALRIRPVLFAGAAVLLVYLLAWGYNDRDPAYAGSGYYPYHRATDVICNLPTDTAGYDLSRLGWTPNDLSMLGFWFWTDDQVFAADKIITFARETKSRRTPQETIRYGIAWAKEEQFAILVILLAAGFILVTSTVSRAEKEFVFINLLLAAALLTYLVVMARVPKRVSTPILFYQALVCLLVIITGRKHAAARLVWLGVVTLVCVYKFGRVYQLSQQKNQKPDLFTEAIRHIDRHPQDLFLVVSKGLPLDQMPVFQKTHDLLPHHNLLLSGWLTYLPAYNQLLKIHGLKNLSADLIGRKNIVLVNGNIRVRETLTEFYREHYGTGVEFIPYEPAFPNLPAYRFVFQDLPKTPAGSP